MCADLREALRERSKSDAADAEAICEAVTRPTMRFVEMKSPEQQAILSLNPARDLIVPQRTQTINMMRRVLAEFGIIFAQGVGHAIQLAKRATEGHHLSFRRLPAMLSQTLASNF